MALYLDTDVQYIKGVGPKLAQSLAKRGIYKVEDLFSFYPRAYEDRRAVRNIASLEPEEMVSIGAQILGVSSQNLGRTKRKVYTVLVRDDSGKIACKFFRTPYRGYFERFQTGQKVRIVGKVTEYRGVKEFHHPDIQDWVETEDQDCILPIYTEIDRISSKKMRSIYDIAFKNLQAPVAEKLPDWVLKKYDLVSRHDAIFNLHNPPKGSAGEFLHYRTPFQKRIIFEELFWLEVLMFAKKQGLKKEDGLPFRDEMSYVSQFLKSLPFELTGAQKRAFEAIKKDLLSPHPMHRMIQGDVGCGKTMVAMLAAAFAKGSEYQSALMVPTEILAKQHFKNAKEYLESIGLKVALLTGNMGAKAKRESLAGLESGEVDLVVGTHALIQKEVQFKNLGLVIIDEQHRFGVEQRKSLKTKGKAPHLLLMTATPIPRSLAMTVYGDLDNTIIDELPSGRIPILTRVVYDSNRHKVMGFMEEQIANGRQAYIVYPLVEESEKMDLKDATREYEKLQETYPKIKFGLLHGKMKEDEKSQIMSDFGENKIQVLVATTVIEVGVDVPNSNMMIIEHSERFGLSQLHQLRGRVGRGKHKSYCVLMLGKAVGQESKDRCDIMARHSDGFKIAEADLEIRGPGVFMGTKQSGLPGFEMANLVRDAVTLQEAREAAMTIFEKDPKLQSPSHASVKEELQKGAGALSLADIG
ncbi:MAG: ATP-dependent DNA helicase RecG [Bdellovibrionota bacterium]|nr:ATP-dependent DNA helicase RecG [Bdellovibrionota bacterium]